MWSSYIKLSNRHPKQVTKGQSQGHIKVKTKNAKKSCLHLKLFLKVLILMQYSTQILYLNDI